MIMHYLHLCAYTHFIYIYAGFYCLQKNPADWSLPFRSQLLPVRQKMKWDEEWQTGTALFGIMEDSATKYISPWKKIL